MQKKTCIYYKEPYEYQKTYRKIKSSFNKDKSNPSGKSTVMLPFTYSGSVVASLHGEPGSYIVLCM